MSFKFQPKTEEEISSGFEPLPAGKYPFTMMESAVAQSKSEKNKGREMVKVKINVHGNFDKHVYDYFADWFSEWKLKHICESIGLSKEYSAGEIDPSDNGWQGRGGYVKLGVEIDKQSGEEKNYVVDYIPAGEKKESKKNSPKAAAASDNAPQESDDVPF